MPGRNDPCPCGSGRKYKKCCLQHDQDLARQKAAGEETFASFKQAAMAVERCLVRELGTAIMDRWADPFIEDLELEAHTFQEFSVCHIPFEGASCPAEWAASRITLEPRQQEVLDVAVATPYSYWEIAAIINGEKFVLQDLLTRKMLRVPLIEELVNDTGNVFLGKVMPWKDQFQLLSYCPVFMRPEATGPLIEAALEGKESLTPEQLLDPSKAAQLYLNWWDEVRSRMGRVSKPWEFSEEESSSWEPGIQEVLDDFLDDRAATVSRSTFNRDRRAVEILSFYLVGIHGDSDYSIHPEQYLTQTNYRTIVSALPGFAEFLPNCRLAKSRAKAKGFATSIKLLVKWMAEAELLDTEERDILLDALEAGGPPQGPLTFLFRLTLVESEPPVWRDLRIPGRYRLDQVHRMFQMLFGWQDYHLHDFQFGDIRYTDLDTLAPEYEMGEMDEKVPLLQALGWRRSFLYRYDFGDSWEVQARLLERVEGDLDAPEILDGAQAGPPEDCGGIPGFQELKEVLADPKHPEYEDMRTWAPPGYDASKFSAQTMTNKLVRQFGRKSKKPKAPEASELAGFRLSKMNVLAAIVAALKEKSPRTIEQIHQRLVELNYPLKAGLDSLRRALAKADYVRTRLDGALELIPGEPLRRALFWMEYRSEEGLPKEKREVVVSSPTGPVTREEIDQARPHGTFPLNLSLRRKLILVLDAIGGEASVDDTLAELGQMTGGRNSRDETEALRTLKGTSAVEIEGHNLKVVPDSSELKKARDAYRKWTLPILKAKAERAQWEEKAEVRQAERREEIRAERERLPALARVVISAHWSLKNFALAARRVDDTDVQWFTHPEDARESLGRAGVVIGLDPRTGFERMGWNFPDTLMVDLTPSFKSMPTFDGPRMPVSTSEAIAMVTGQGLYDEEQVARWAAQAQEKKLRETLQADLGQLYSYWRFGLIHHAVLRGNEWMPVHWNVCKEIELHDAITWCQEDRRPLKLWVKDGTQGDFLPQMVEWNARYGEENVVHGTWQDDGRRAALRFNQIVDCVYPYEASLERLEKVIW